MHERVVDLDLMSALQCQIKELFEFQGWSHFFSSTPKVVYEPFIRLFYANLRSSKADELETLVLGKRIFLNYALFDHIFHICSSGFYASLKNAWPSDLDVSFEEAKRFIALDNSDPLPSQLGPKDLSFETRVIAHIVATTLLPRVGSLSSLTRSDTLLTYSLVSRRKIKISSFMINYMIEVASDPFSLPYGMIISRIIEVNNISVVDIPSLTINQCYNSKTFKSMGYVRTEDSWCLSLMIPLLPPPPKSWILLPPSLQIIIQIF